MKNLIRENYGTPLLIISHRSLNIEKPADIANQIAEESLKRKLDPSSSENSSLKRLKESIESKKGPIVIHKHRKAKGPNPLSCKKKKKPSNNNNNKIKRLVD